MISKSIQEQIKKLPTHAGVYLFLDKNEEILYIGKAVNIKKRIQSHFAPKSSERPMSAKLYPQVKRIDFIATKTEKDALLLEQRLVKLHQPKYNIELKDDKSYARVAITNELLPRILVARQTKNLNAEFIGPFVESRELKSFLGKIRLLLPYRTCKNKAEKPCLDYHLGLCPAHGTKINQYPLYLQGIRALLQLYNGENPLLECYDISHTHGSNTSASMVIFKGSRKYSAGYRLFNIRSKTNGDDPRALKETLERRLTHSEWQLPGLILIDGGRSQLSQLKHIPLPIIGIAKYNRESGRATLYSPYSNRSVELSSLPEIISQTFLRIRDEAHRFAIKQQRKRQNRNLSNNKKP
ncbi:MAG: GIY-YIG nuclease family protein [Patescibacteria group bacterium]|nr:GIY-YIG nuclease family protein [Patescibacteria group bacterium]